MHKLYQTSTLILVTILLSTSSLSGCHSPKASREEPVNNPLTEQDRRQKEEIALWNLELQEFLEMCKKYPSYSNICPEAAPELLVEVAFYELQQQKASNSALEGLKDVVYQVVTEEAQKLGINLSDTELRKISALVTVIYTHPVPEYIRQQRDEQTKIQSAPDASPTNPSPRNKPDNTAAILRALGAALSLLSSWEKAPHPNYIPKRIPVIP